MGANDLSFDMTADPSEFTEAVAEFSARRVISREEADRLSGYARRRSWWISGVAQMDVANDAHQSIVEAMRSGVPFEEWQKTAGAAIERDWGRKDSARLLLIFRNATSQAYNSGRWEQMGEPHIVAARPYKKLSVVNDLRTSDLCRGFISPPVILPANDPWWLTHCPPLHHGCRDGIITLRLGPAKEQGILKTAPTEQADEGFGLAPAYQEPPKPSERKVPPEPEISVKMTEKASRDYRTRKPVEIKIPPKHTPEYWEDHYRAKYGDAARQVGYGRAIHERSRSIPWEELVAAAEDLESKGVPGLDRNVVLHLKVGQRVGNDKIPRFLADDIEVERLLVAHTRLLQFKRPSAIPLQTLTHQTSAERLAGAAKWYEAFASDLLEVPPVKWEVHNDPHWRAFIYPEPARRNAHLGINDKVHTWVHEWGHAVERSAQSTVNKVKAFRAAREAGEAALPLADVTGIAGYESWERTRKDKYWEPYVGKVYTDDSSEFVSQLFGDLAKGLGPEILKKDPESLYFGLGLLAGY